MSIEYMPVTADSLELPLAPPMPSRAAVARWAGISEKHAHRRNVGEGMGFRIVGVRV